MAEQQLTPFQQQLQKVYTLAQQLPPEQREVLLRKYYEQKLQNSPEFLRLYPSMSERASLYKGFTGEDMLHAPEPEPNVLQRIGGLHDYQNPLTTNPWAHLGNVGNFFGTPGRAVQEGVDASLGAAGVKQPNKGGTAIGPGSVLPDTLGGWSKLPTDWYAGKPMMAAARFPFQTLSILQKWARGIEEAKAAAKMENMAWDAGVRPGAPKALPAASGPGTWPMPGSVPSPSGYPPWVRMPRGPAETPRPFGDPATGHAPRPPELMPRPRGGEPRIINGEAWSE